MEEEIVECTIRRTGYIAYPDGSTKNTYSIVCDNGFEKHLASNASLEHIAERVKKRMIKIESRKQEVNEVKVEVTLESGG